MSIYEPERHLGKVYLIVFIFAATILAWGVLTQYRQLVINTSCSEVAARNSDILTGKKLNVVDDYNFYELQNDCMNESLSKK